MSRETKHPCAGITRFGQPCKNLVDAAHVFCFSHTPLLTYEEAEKVFASMRELGVLKAGEHPTRVHDVRCPRPQDDASACTCRHVEIVWPDYKTRVGATR